MDTIYKKLNSLYKKRGYAERYGGDIWMTIIIFLIFFIWVSYYYTLNHIQPIKADWVNKRCTPSVIPFSGLIMKAEGQSTLDATGENFTYCTQSILKSIAGYAFEPINYVMAVLIDTFNEFVSALDSIRGLFDNVRNSFSDITGDVMGRSLNITTPLTSLIINAKDMAGKVQGTITAGIYTLLGSFLALNSLFKSILSITLVILAGLTATIVGLWALVVPTFGATAIPAAAFTVIYVAIAVVLAIVAVFTAEVLHAQSTSIPSAPSCFDKNTDITLYDSTTKPISDIKINDILHDGSVVTAKMELSTQGKTLYNLDGIIVTGDHSIFYTEWIPISEHPESIKISEYNEPLIYCLNTDTKTIKIKNHIFSDWDDLDDTDLDELRKNCPHIPANFKNRDIHAYFNSGLTANTPIRLQNGEIKPICDIKVNDILYYGERVRGIVEIENNINLGDNELLYHLLTYEGYFHRDGVKISDYNVAIEKYLSY